MIEFEKMHGLGNNFIVFSDFKNKIENYSELAKKICNKNFGLGADALIIAKKSKEADVKMVYFNADGTEANMCGNGIRCFGKYVYDNNIVSKEEFDVETNSGIKEVKVFTNEGVAELVQVNMGKPTFESEKIPVNTTANEFLKRDVIIGQNSYTVSAIEMGSPNAVIFVDDVEKIDVEREGYSLEKSKLFPNGINVNFAQRISKDEIKVITWERGVGYTTASGTGAASSVVIGRKYFGLNRKVNVSLPGGCIGIEESLEGNIVMLGLATRVAKGVYYENAKECD